MQKSAHRPFYRKWFRWGIALILVIILPRVITTVSTWTSIKNIDKVEQTKYGIVLAAETTPHGFPSAVLRDRIERGVDLYFSGKVAKLVMSGMSPEPAIMRNYAVALGVPEEDIVLDNGGIRTYATCYIAATQLDLEEAIFVTQPFHLPRTVFLCRALGIEATGVAADHGRYWRGSWLAWNLRETLATVLAFQDLYFSPPDTNLYLEFYQGG